VDDRHHASARLLPVAVVLAVLDPHHHPVVVLDVASSVSPDSWQIPAVPDLLLHLAAHVLASSSYPEPVTPFVASLVVVRDL
jgi:hypothetical protein